MTVIDIFLILSFGMALWAFYYWWKKDHHTRDRFAFTGFLALLGFALFYAQSLQGNVSIIDRLFAVFLKPWGWQTAPAPSPLTPMEAVLIGLVLLGIGYVYLQIFTHWNGRKSIAQHEQEQRNEKPHVVVDIGLLLTPSQWQKLKPYQDDPQQDEVLQAPESLTWHVRAKQLWVLHHRTYRFDGAYDEARQCWLGQEQHTGALVLLMCLHKAPDEVMLHGLSLYARKVADRHDHPEIELIVALKQDSLSAVKTETRSDYTLTITSEGALLQDLVDFSDYFADLRYRVERERLVESHRTLADIYVPSGYRLEKNGETQKTSLETHIREWLQDPTRQQLAILGEYGQGKSTASLLLSYHLQAEMDSASPPPRIPILIELRGKSLRSLSPKELLATWAYRFRIDTQALLHLHMAGRLLLIFEGFDEIDLSGDVEARIRHFHTMWQLNDDQAKIIITGRPNFFLDSRELKRALSTVTQTQTLYLAPFDLEQIRAGLRAEDPHTQHGILNLATNDLKFLDIVSRPSLLYLVARLWETLSDYDNINSAQVIARFIQRTLLRQQDKEDGIHSFMVLNSAERPYFMAGIAAYMAAHSLPNQIDKHALEKAVGVLIDIIPDVVSQNAGAGEDGQPLRTRLDWEHQRTNILQTIQTDVRSCGLLITDASKDGTFKFAHKSYMELLQAQTFNPLASDDLGQASIVNAWKLRINHLQSSDEAIGFLAELLKMTLQAQGVVDDEAIAKAMWDILVIGKKSKRKTCVNFFMTMWVSAGSRLSGWLVSKFGIAKRHTISSIILLILLAATAVAVAVGVGVAAGVAAGAAVAVAVAAGVGATYLGIMVLLTIKLIEKYHWLWHEALLVIVPSMTASFLVSIIIGLALDILNEQNQALSKRMHLWHRACQNLGLSHHVVEKTVGTGMAILLAGAHPRRR